jgi:hypothetical protein
MTLICALGTTPESVMIALPGDYDTDPERFLSSEKYPHDDVHPYVAGRFAAAGARIDADRAGLCRLRHKGTAAACATAVARRH